MIPFLAKLIEARLQHTIGGFTIIADRRLRGLQGLIAEQ